MINKILKFVLVSTLVVALSGCNSNTNDSSEKSLVLGVSGTPTELEVLKEIAADFTEESGIAVTLKTYTDFNTEIRTELVGGTAPDIFQLDSFVLPFYAGQGLLLELDAKELSVDESYENLREAFTFDNSLYAFPKDYSTLALYYNKEFIPNGDDIPETAEEIKAFLEEIQPSLPSDVMPATVNVDLARNMYIMQNGGLSISDDDGFATLTDKDMEENLTPMFDLLSSGLAKTPKDLGYGWNGEAFGSGKVAIMVEGNWVNAELKNNYSDVDFGVKEIPVYNNEKGSMLFAGGYGVNSATKNSEEAIEFLKYFNTDKVLEKWAVGSGTLPPKESVAESLKLDENDEYIPHINATEYATIWKKSDTLEIISTQYGNYMESVVSKKRTISEALKITQEEANKIIEAEK